MVEVVATEASDATLMDAIARGDALEVSRWLQRGKSVRYMRTAAGRTAAMLACMHGHSACLSQILSAIHDPRVYLQARDVAGRTAAMFATIHGHRTCLRMVLDVGDPRVLARDLAGRNAVAWAAAKGHTRCLLELLLRFAIPAGSSSWIHAVDYFRRSPLELAVRFNHPECVRLLMESGASSDRVVMMAAARGHIECLQKLLSPSCTFLSSSLLYDAALRTPLMFAAAANHVACVHALLTNEHYNAHVNAQDELGRTALMWATNGGHEQCVRLLVSKSANPNLQDAHGRTSLMRAVMGGFTRCVVHLLPPTTRPNIQDDQGRTALMWAAKGGQLACLAAILHSSTTACPVDARLSDKTGTTALQHALRSNHDQCIVQLARFTNGFAQAQSQTVHL